MHERILCLKIKKKSEFKIVITNPDTTMTYLCLCPLKEASVVTPPGGCSITSGCLYGYAQPYAMSRLIGCPFYVPLLAVNIPGRSLTGQHLGFSFQMSPRERTTTNYNNVYIGTQPVVQSQGLFVSSIQCCFAGAFLSHRHMGFQNNHTYKVAISKISMYQLFYSSS